jgi:chorismate mutase
MPRIALSRASLAALQNEIQRRTKNLAKMIAERDALNEHIAEIEAVVGPQQPVRRGKKPGPKPGRKAKAAAAPKPGKRGVFKESAAEMILRLLAGGKPVSSTEIAAAWQKAGRAGRPSKTLSDMVKVKKIKRQVLKGTRANNYTLA